MRPGIKFELYQDKEGGTHHYHIGMDIKHERFDIHFMSPEKFTIHEANRRIIYLAAGLDADTDGIKIANHGIESDS